MQKKLAQTVENAWRPPSSTFRLWTFLPQPGETALLERKFYLQSQIELCLLRQMLIYSGPWASAIALEQSFQKTCSPHWKAHCRHCFEDKFGIVLIFIFSCFLFITIQASTYLTYVQKDVYLSFPLPYLSLPRQLVVPSNISEKSFRARILI